MIAILRRRVFSGYARLDSSGGRNRDKGTGRRGEQQSRQDSSSFHVWFYYQYFLIEELWGVPGIPVVVYQ